MMRPPELSGPQRLQAATVTGAVEWLILGGGRHLTAEAAVAHVHALSTDPTVLGNVLGAYLERARELVSLQEAIELLRAAGADEEVAEAKAAWLRERHGHGPA